MIHHWLNLRLLVSVILSFTALSHAGPGIDAEGFIKARTDALASIAASTDPEDALFKTYKIYKEFLDRIGAQDLLTPLRKTRIDALTIKNQPEYGSARITLPLTGQGADNLRRKGVYFDCTIALDGGKVRSWNVRYVVPVMTLEELSKLFGKGRVFSKRASKK